MVANVTVKRSKHVQDGETRITLQQTALTRRAENVERSVIWQVHVDLLGLRSPRPREAARRARVQAQPRRAGVVAKVGTCPPSVPRARSLQWKS